MKISKYFTKEEFEASPSAKKHGISNAMNIEQIINAVHLCANILDPLREWLGKPLIITSGFRSEALNLKMRGAKYSQHMAGQAADLKIGKQEFEYIRQHLPFDQLILEYGNSVQPDWVHVSFSFEKNRGQVLRAIKGKGYADYSD